MLPLTKSTVPEFPLQSVNYTEAEGIQAFRERRKWLNALDSLDEEKIEDNIKDRMSWSAFHSNEVSNVPVKSLSTLLPLLHESINSTAMVRHTIDIIKQILLKINPNQCPVITADQPVYTLGKQIQWLYPDQYGEDKLVMMMGALHIEMAFLNAIGDWLEGSGCADILVKAEISANPKAQTFLVLVPASNADLQSLGMTKHFQN